MDRKTITGELVRVCGWDNAMLTYEIDTETNRVIYRLRTYQRGVGGTDRIFSTYANAVAALECFEKMLQRRKENQPPCNS